MLCVLMGASPPMATPPIKICLVLTLFSSIKPLHQLNSYALLYSFLVVSYHNAQILGKINYSILRLK
ncbi:hypothetical protein DDP38_03815 [Helicobacter pylori]|nr:hypothetical protein C2R74_06365 [Helicobacter pylori]RKU96830.1 hypothetical protein DDP38_03815 [Helicobacter pylori]